MPRSGRKVPFSGRAKKLQMQRKKMHHTQGVEVRGDQRGTSSNNSSGSESETMELKSTKLNAPASSSLTVLDVNRYALQFHQQSMQEIESLKKRAHHELSMLPETDLEVGSTTPYPCTLDFPKRPAWNFLMSRKALDARENKYFKEYVETLSKQFSWQELSYFEMNLETWRQLWRVLEMSDIVLIIVDIRFPVYLFPPSLYSYVVEELQKNMILVLNKIDLAAAPLVLAWKHFFKTHYPSLQVLLFTSYPGYNLRGCNSNKGGLQVRRRKGKLRMAAEGAQQILQACEQIVGDKVDLSSWHRKIADELHTEHEDETVEVEETIELSKVDTSFVEHEEYKGGVLTIGCVGHPNVGKSSLMNAIMGKKVVSVSKTPGHTKHFQTIYLTPTVRLCDCPGLVFPSKVPKPLQVLMGSYPIAQLREPYSSVQFLAERIDLVQLLRLQHPENDTLWSAFDVCDAWAIQRGFYTAKAARPDSYRAANNILRMALEGKICLCLYPPKYVVEKEIWTHHKDLSQVEKIQAKSDIQNAPSGQEEFVLEDSDEETVAANSAHQSKSSSTSESEEDLNPSTNKFALLEEDD